MPPTDLERIRHIIDYARKALEFTHPVSQDSLAKDEVLVLALTRLIEIIGEAARNVSPSMREKHAEIPWLDMSDTRNKLIHAYDEVDLDVLWDITQNDLPPLIESLEKIVAAPPEG